MTKLQASARTPANPLTPLVGWALALGALSFLVERGALVSVDHHVASWVATLRSPSLDGSVQLVTFFGGSKWTLLALAGLGVLAWRRRGGPAVLILIGAFAIAALMEVALRLSIPQWRPDALTVPASMDLAMRFELAGFPSGHGFRSAFVFGWLARELKGSRLSLFVCLVIIGLVGASRLYLNRHWASDVLGGWLVALVALSLARVWEQRFYKHAS